jgi:hypothetical protein
VRGACSAVTSGVISIGRIRPDLTLNRANNLFRGQLARHSLPEFQTTGRSREDDDEDENEAPMALERVAQAPIYLHEIVPGAVDEVVIGFAEYAEVRCEPVFQAGTRVAEHVTVAVSSVSKLETICDETAEPTRTGEHTADTTESVGCKVKIGCHPVQRITQNYVCFDISRRIITWDCVHDCALESESRI